MPPARQSQLNTLVGLLTLSCGVVGVVFFIAPLNHIPKDVSDMKDELSEVAAVQRVQTETLKTLAEVASDSKQMRRDVDKNAAQLESCLRRLERLEKN